ncbi:ATPase/histidine kinase/DNA gyrase B/HSP90 domain protein [Gemella bergeri ATCC 700627]|uniref:histidine kinase n=1 Tax=Gemella bergeri ATCC 700627 TaxID=1321820 RepID=U2QKR0_9BACL|nr:HAMP domain-containing sensor histidine kinase [Gemella bergeri]ERK57081.1 ATPase/histidine kinase/DNA gyrase B/HSP90 domain protein [Gemella bergeri ATCC 700627]
MKLKNYILIGYLISTLITIVAVIWAVNKMLIDTKGTYFIILTTIVASIIGAVVSLFLLSRVFSSLASLKKQVNYVSEKKFDFVTDVKNPIEFAELAKAFNEMSKNLEETFESLAESEKEKSIMIAQLSHDIKTPITSIQATVEGMLDGVIDKKEYPHYFKTIGRQTERLDKLVEELNYLTLNTFDKENDFTGKDIIFLDKLLIDCMSEFRLLIEKEKRDIYIKVIPESAKIVSSYDKLLRIIVNLINNAFKYSKKGTKVEVIAEVKNNKLQISVIDEGQGISPEELDSIFKRFYRVETSRNLETGGYGLGLSIAKQLAHQLNGDILVKSEYGKGSTFSLILNDIEKDNS